MRIVGIDGGGTKTDAVLCDESGRVYKRVIGGPASPTSQPVETAVVNLRRVMEELMAEYGGLEGRIDALFAGISGGGVGDNAAMLRWYFAEMLPGCVRLDNYNDAVNALRSAIPSGDGMIAISGTGSSVFANVNGEMFQAGGWGYLLGDEGSGFDLGRRALKSALREIDGRGEATSMTLACEKILAKPVNRAIPEIYAGGRAEIASFATVLLDAAEQGDAVASRQLDAAVESLAETIRAAGRYIETEQKRVAIAGSVWKNALYCERMRRALGEEYVLCRTDLPPVYGSFVVALRQAGIPVTDEIENAFRRTLPQNDDSIDH